MEFNPHNPLPHQQYLLDLDDKVRNASLRIVMKVTLWSDLGIHLDRRPPSRCTSNVVQLFQKTIGPHWRYSKTEDNGQDVWTLINWHHNS